MAITTRQITYASMSIAGANSIFSNAETWGELKNAEADIAAKALGMKALVRESKVELVSDEQALPTGNFTIYFVMEKNNSGTEKSVEEMIEEFVETHVKRA